MNVIILIVSSDCDLSGGVKGKVTINKESLEIPAPMLVVKKGEPHTK